MATIIGRSGSHITTALVMSNMYILNIHYNHSAHSSSIITNIRRVFPYLSWYLRRVKKYFIYHMVSSLPLSDVVDIAILFNFIHCAPSTYTLRFITYHSHVCDISICEWTAPHQPQIIDNATVIITYDGTWCSSSHLGIASHYIKRCRVNWIRIHSFVAQNTHTQTHDMWCGDLSGWGWWNVSPLIAVDRSNHFDKSSLNFWTQTQHLIGWVNCVWGCTSDDRSGQLNVAGKFIIYGDVWKKYIVLKLRQWRCGVEMILDHNFMILA